MHICPIPPGAAAAGGGGPETMRIVWMRRVSDTQMEGKLRDGLSSRLSLRIGPGVGE